MPRLVRIPDISYVSHERMAECATADAAMPDLAPDLAVEVLSEGNTPGEMERKLRDYFFAGTSQVWLVDPRRHLVQRGQVHGSDARREPGREADDPAHAPRPCRTF